MNKPNEIALSDQLSLIAKIQAQIANVTDIGELKSIRDQAEAARVLARAATDGLELQNRAAELKLRAERRVGQLLIELPLHGGDRRSSTQHEHLKLADLGIDRNQSARWQKVASMTDGEFEEFITSTLSAGAELSTAGAIRHAKRLRNDLEVSTTDCADETIRSDHELTEICELLSELGGHHMVLTNIVENFRSMEDFCHQRSFHIFFRCLDEITNMISAIRERALDHID